MKNLIKCTISLGCALAVMAGGSAGVGAEIINGKVVNTVTVREQLEKESSVYVGEVYVTDKGSTVKKLTYIYSEDITNTFGVRDNLRNAVGLEDAKALLDAVVVEGEEPGLALSTEYADEMTTDWASAKWVAEKYFEGEYKVTGIDLLDGSHTDDETVLLYDYNAEAKAYIDSEDAEAAKSVNGGEPVDSKKGIVSHIDSSTVDVITYTVVDGQIIKNVNTIIKYKCERTGIYYTKAVIELSPEVPMLKGDTDGDGKLSYLDVSLMTAFANSETVFSEEQKARSDLDGDSLVTYLDVSILIDRIANA